MISWQLENVFKCHKALIFLAFSRFNIKYQRVFTSITTTYPDAWCVFLWAIWWSSINADKKWHFKTNSGFRNVLLISLLNADCHHYSLGFTVNSFHWCRTRLEIQVVCLILVQGTYELKASIKLVCYSIIILVFGLETRQILVHIQPNDSNMHRMQYSFVWKSQCMPIG